MPISSARRTQCMGCRVPSSRKPRRACRYCGRRLCASCLESHPCPKRDAERKCTECGLLGTSNQMHRFGGPDAPLTCKNIMGCKERRYFKARGTV